MSKGVPMSGSPAGGRLMCLMVMMMRRERTERNDGVAEAEREEDGLPDGRAGGGVLTRARGRMSQQAATDERSPTVGGPPTMNLPSLSLRLCPARLILLAVSSAR